MEAQPPAAHVQVLYVPGPGWRRSPALGLAVPRNAALRICVALLCASRESPDARGHIKNMVRACNVTFDLRMCERVCAYLDMNHNVQPLGQSTHVTFSLLCVDCPCCRTNASVVCVGEAWSAMKCVFVPLTKLMTTCAVCAVLAHVDVL